MNALSALCLTVLSVSLLLTVVFVLRARTLVDRAIGIDTMVGVIMNGLAVVVVATTDSDIVDLMLLVAILAFIGTVSVARFVEQRGHSLDTEDRT